ncbi:MAG: DNA gyrase subunit A [Candidatus Omnitrophica bacterium]|nr:DNA gyrase subunit A [Candidatus Omnitrophota bacterium]MDD5351614.1 DNA gyrase subunit A [Candidatus Omnitrophota bacterium]MDD5550824.1 DNA gyrase subunit A [Candidatus Omnitrophota bacterium]
MYTQNERIVPIGIEEEMKSSYISYAMSVIVGRALPDIRDGLKPVHRRILYAMHELNLEHSNPYKKSARIVGEVLGKYHPHGDVAVYDALVRMVQDFSLRYPLIDGQGNFGSVDGDAPAAMRYTEARLARVSDEMLRDIEKETVNFSPNFDASLNEPVLLPAVLPNLLVNGSGGIAVGMATNIPPHNLSEVIDGIVYLIDNPEAQTKDLMHYIKGPDFPTGGIICGRTGIKEAFDTGKGKIMLRAKVNIEHQKSGKDWIVVTEIPYQVNKANLIETIANLVTDKKIDGITDIRDESDKDGMRIVLELRREVEPQIVLNFLYKHTQLEVTYGIITLALVNGRPRILSLKEVMQYYIEHRKDIIRRRTRFDLDRAQKRAHILEGLKIALKHLDQIIKTIRSSKNAVEAKDALVKKFDLSPEQAQAILEMQLQRLTALERDKIEAEYLDLIKKIELYKSILASEKKIEGIIKEELAELKKKYGDERKTEIIGEVEDIEIEDLIAEEDMVVTISSGGYIKRLSVSAYRKQRRGGKGVTAMETKEEDFVKHLFVASTKDYLLIFSNQGRVYWLKVYEIPAAGRQAKGKAIVNILAMGQGEDISSVIAVKEFTEGKFLVMCTKQGLVKKTDLPAFSNPRKGGIIGITLEKDDALINTALTDGDQEILLAARSGKSVRFKEKQVRDMGRQAKGVRGISLAKKDEVIGMAIVSTSMNKSPTTLLTVTAGGFAKRTSLADYRIQSRGGKGIINIKTTKKNGEAIGVMVIEPQDEIMVVTQKGMIVRCAVKDIRQTGRNTQGVRLINLDKADAAASVARVVAKDEE